MDISATLVAAAILVVRDAPWPADEPRLPKLGCCQNFGNLRGIDRGRHAAARDLQLAASELVRDRRYLGLNFLAAVKAYPDAGADAVIHASKYTRSRFFVRQGGSALGGRSSPRLALAMLGAVNF